MTESMHTAATGMAAQQTTMNVISNNLANVTTAGFKRGRVEFQDLVYRQQRVARESTAEGVSSPVGFEMGLGTGAAATHKIFLAGELQHTETPWTWPSTGPASSKSACRTAARRTPGTARSRWTPRAAW